MAGYNQQQQQAYGGQQQPQQQAGYPSQQNGGAYNGAQATDTSGAYNQGKWVSCLMWCITCKLSLILLLVWNACRISGIEIHVIYIRLYCWAVKPSVKW